MNKIFFYIFISFFIITFSNASSQNFTKLASSSVVYTQQGDEKQWCPICGMSIKKFYKTSHSATLHNGLKRQYCSIHCLSKDNQDNGIDINNIQVVDAKTEKLINANKAFYVINSKIKGTMSKVSKLAFEKKEDAKTFISKYGGTLSTFSKALEEATKSLKSDIHMTKNKKIKKIYPKGKKIFEKRCNQNIDFSLYLEINELKADLKNNKLCKKLKESQLQMVALYLWDVKKVGTQDSSENIIEIEKNDKCPVCGMFVAKYPRWVAQIFYQKNNIEHKLSFDGVKDLMKFYFNSKKWGDYEVNSKNIKEILVTDYYSQQTINGKKAFYVIGSDIYGPMGRELIPFINLEDAKTFKEDHEGTAIIGFKEIVEKEVYKLDE